MRLFIFLSVFYAIMVIFGISTSYAGGACSAPQCGKQQTAADVEFDEAEITAKIMGLLGSIEDKISTEKLHAMIKKAAQENAQVADLLKLVQQYGVLTEIKLDEPENS